VTVLTTIFQVEALCCADEERLIRKKLGETPGIAGFGFNLISRTLTVQHSCTVESIVDALRDIGFKARLSHALDEPQTFWERRNYLLFTVTAILFLGAGIIAVAAGSPQPVTIPLFLCSIAAGGWRIALKGFKAGKNLALDMNFLMTIATVGALAIGKWEEGAAVIVLFSLSQLLERYSMERSRKAIRALLNLSPAMATVRRGTQEVEVAVEEVAIGERIVIRPGERIPLDGLVEAGESTVNQAPITGESLPVPKGAGHEVFAGSLNERGTLDVKVTRAFRDTTLARIVRMVEEAQTERAPVQNVTERFARIYTPVIIALAVGVAVVLPLLFQQPFGVWFYRSLVLLVIACPCALVISTPVTIVSGLSNAARMGVLIKGGRHLEEIGRVRAVAFDKTGTLTEGAPRVTDVIPLDSLTKTQIIRLTAAVEARSEHHLAGAILKRADEEELSFDHLAYQQFESLTGKGVRATVDGVAYIVGNHALIEEKKICSPKVEELLRELEGDGKTAIILGTEQQALGIIAIADAVRSGSTRITGALHAQGIERVIMLTGDNEGTARVIAGRTGIDEYHAGILPDEKVNRIRALKQRYGSVAMVGDGINDAPALAASSVGIAMGGSGTDVALETADIVLMSDDLSRLVATIQLSRRTLSVVRQNILISLLTKLIFMILAVAGLATLWMAVLADDGATLLVVLNGLRVLGFRGEKASE
jgi:Cd2+/Zn2+-exporting ATPase